MPPALALMEGCVFDYQLYLTVTCAPIGTGIAEFMLLCSRYTAVPLSSHSFQILALNS